MAVRNLAFHNIRLIKGTLTLVITEISLIGNNPRVSYSSHGDVTHIPLPDKYGIVTSNNFYRKKHR